MSTRAYACLFGHVTYESIVTDEQLLKTPIWKLGAAHPPVAARRADRLATERFQRLAGRPPDLTRTEIRLVDMGDGLHWFYAVLFEDVTNPYAGLPPNGTIVVLMDGTVIEPKVSQKP